MTWLRENWGKLLGALAAAFGLVVIAVQKRTDFGRRVLDRTRRRVDEIDTQRKIAVEVLGESAEEVKRLDEELALVRRRTVEAMQRTKGLTDEQVLARFRDLGFVILLCLSAGHVSAQSVVCPGAEPRRAMVMYQGHEGVWFSGEVGRCLLQTVELSASRGTEIRLLQERLRLSDVRSEALETALMREREAGESTRRLLTDAQSALADSRPAWYEHPALWGLIGLVVGVAGSAAIVLAVAR